jgi:hypothetical protein
MKTKDTKESHNRRKKGLGGEEDRREQERKCLKEANKVHCLLLLCIYAGSDRRGRQLIGKTRCVRDFSC